MTSSPRTSSAPNAAKKWGLLPRAGLNPSATKVSASMGGGETYVLPGQVIASSSSSRSGPEYVGEAIGREKHERKKRKRELEAQELELQRLLEKDGGKSEGAKVLAKAREAIRGKPVKSTTTKDKDKEGASGDVSLPRRRVFSATAIQRIGFDPTAKRGERPRDDDKIVSINL
jgi:minichromosome maintenance protein 10